MTASSMSAGSSKLSHCAMAAPQRSCKVFPMRDMRRLTTDIARGSAEPSLCRAERKTAGPRGGTAVKRSQFQKLRVPSLARSRREDSLALPPSMLLAGWLLAASCALHVRVPVHKHVRIHAIAMSDTDDISIPDPKFASDELSRTWERSGKGKKRWQPGDATGDTALDMRLLYSNWVLNPMQLLVREGCSQSTAARLLLGWLGLPFTAVPSADEPLPRIEGSGVPSSAGGEGDGGLNSYGEICSFAVGVAQKREVGVVAPATGREDVAVWLEAPSVASFVPLLRGVQPGDRTPCVNAWGLSMDDAAVLPVLKVLVDGSDEDSDEMLMLRQYVSSCYRKAGMSL